MSTRSGKRIHATEDSTIVDTDVMLQRERKTRSKKQKENVEECVVKKSNYVSYPVDEYTASAPGDTGDPQEKLRKKGNTRRSTLKDHNVLVPVSDNLESNNDKTVRKSRRGKTLLKGDENDENSVYSQNQTQSEPAVNGKKRNKKKKKPKKDSVESSDIKMEVLKKKVIKKKKKLRSVINDQEADIGPGDTSDSFHSAAGSPANSKLFGVENHIEEQEIEDNILTTVTEAANTLAASETIINASRKRIRKSSTKNSTFDKIETEFDKGNLSQTFDKSASVVTDSEITTELAMKTKRKSTANDSIFEKTEIEFDKVNLSQTFDKSASVITNSEITTELAMKKKRKSGAKDSTFDKTELKNANEEKLNTTFDKKPDILTPLNVSVDVSFRKRKRSTINNSTMDNNKANDLDEGNLNTTCDKMSDMSTISNSTVDISTRKRRRSSIKNSTFDSNKVDAQAAMVDNYFSDFDHAIAVNSLANGNLTAKNDTPNTSLKLAGLQETEKLNNTYNNDNVLDSVVQKTSNRRRKSDVINSTYDKIDTDLADSEVKANSTFDKDDIGPPKSSLNNGSFKAKKSLQRNNTTDDCKQSQMDTLKIFSEDYNESSKLNTTFNKDNGVLNATFDTERKSEPLIDSMKSSPRSSGATINVTFDNSGENSRISIASDVSKTENILNHTPVLIESSIDESMSGEKTPETLKTPVTPLKREGTFTKETSDVIMSPKFKESVGRTPDHRKSSPGRTPFPFSKSSQKENAKLNVTRSIEKSLRRSSLVEVAPRQTRVMFCSPVNNQAVVSQVKGRVIKSNLKGSNKSFVIEDSVSSEARPGRRKRSFTVGAGAAVTAGGETETRAKRTRLGDELQHSVDRLSRPRTQSAAAKLSTAGSPAPAGRTRLPDFAALHRRQFARMESLDECQRRRARRARALLTPTGSHSLLERISPKGTPPKPPLTKEPSSKLRTPTRPKLPTLDSLIPGYTRFGFKLNVDENPFEGTRTEVRKVVRPAVPLPSLTGTAGGRRAAARQTVMREKSFSEKRDVKRSETRTVIRGVRTNRRFELQMKMRNA